MERSRADRILGDWDRISRQASRPCLPARRAVTTTLRAPTMTAAALLVVVVIAAGLWFGLPARVGPPATEASASPVEPSTAPVATWGPLAVIPPPDGADSARTEGTLRITEACVTLERGSEVTLLFWPADRTAWGEGTRTVTFENFDGSTVAVGDGDAVVLGGSGDSAAESGTSGEDRVASMEWVAPPASSCPLGAWWFVGAVERPGAQLSASPAPVVAEAAGLKLVAAFDRLEVEAGGTVTVGLSIENTRPTDVVFEEPCDTDALTVELRVPVEPIGRDWDGIAAAFKTYALEESTGSPMESSIRTPVRTMAAMQPCHAVKVAISGTGVPTTIIGAGTTYETVLTWNAEIVAGLPAAPGPAPFSLKVRYDQESAGGGLITAETLEARGMITVLDGAPGAVGAGVALDAALDDSQFATWLAKQPRDSWVNANLFLQPRAFGVDVLPAVPYWDVELYREPRNWAVLYIDAVSGEVLGRNFCDIPCDR